jgi:hypothetical protein
MARNVYKTDPRVAAIHLGKPEIDRYASLFFLGQAVRVDTSERFYERRLTVIDMPRCSDDYIHVIDILTAGTADTAGTLEKWKRGCPEKAIAF